MADSLTSKLDIFSFYPTTMFMDWFSQASLILCLTLICFSPVVITDPFDTPCTRFNPNSNQPLTTTMVPANTMYLSSIFRNRDPLVGPLSECAEFYNGYWWLQNINLGQKIPNNFADNIRDYNDSGRYYDTKLYESILQSEDTECNLREVLDKCYTYHDPVEKTRCFKSTCVPKAKQNYDSALLESNFIEPLDSPWFGYYLEKYGRTTTATGAFDPEYDELLADQLGKFARELKITNHPIWEVEPEDLEKVLRELVSNRTFTNEHVYHRTTFPS